MRIARWLDHLPPWLAWMAMLTTGIFEPGELGLMVTPLLLALGVEFRRLQLRPFERWINAGALVFALALLLMRVQLLSGVTYLLFLLCGSRLALPRTLGQRRQILLMGFLLFLVAALAVFDLAVGLWLLVWLLAAMALLMQHAWEQSARHQAISPPFRRLVPYAAAATLLAALCFVALPRLAWGSRFPWLPGLGWGHNVAGFSDRLELGGGGPVAANAQVVLRVMPKGPLAAEEGLARRTLGLLRGTTLEAFDGSTWQPLGLTPRVDLLPAPDTHRTMEADFFLAPSPQAIVPHPYGFLALASPESLQILPLEGGGLRLRLAPRQMVPLPVRFQPHRAGFVMPEAAPTGRRRAFLVSPGEGTDFVHQWGLAVAPADAPPRAAAEALAARLRAFRYTRDNPSGQAEQPLQDFLFRTQAGHCEYFASALALLLRHRGIPARVVNGYQLGTWVPEGGYFVVTQNEAHSWVEYYDPDLRGWRAVDATPAAPSLAWAGEGLRAHLQRWVDALQFRWERYVVRFSDADQMTGLSRLQGWFDRVRMPSDRARALAPVGWLAVALLLLRLAWRMKRWGRFGSGASQAHLPELRPLVRCLATQAPPQAGETARTWLGRLASLRPERAETLAHLADRADRAAYGSAQDPELAALVSEERRAWRGWKA